MSIDRRKESRSAGSSEVTLLVDEPVSTAVHGQLVDVSASGFRARHHCHQLPAGQRVRFRHTSLHGEAQVVWNRILDGVVETGFLVLSMQ